MRLSTDKDDAGYDEKAWKAKPYLNDKEVIHGITADEEKGYILQCKTNEDGAIQLNEDRTDVLKEELYGNVRIEMEA